MDATTLEEKTAEHWKNFPETKLPKKQEVSKRYGCSDISKDGGGDIDLADYSLEGDKYG